MTSVWFVLLSFVVGLVCTFLLRRLDKYEREPFATLFAVTVWGGLWANFICLFLYGSLRRLGIHDLENSLGALLVIGPVEEISKWLALLTSYFIFARQMDEPLDGILYMACVALGFSLIENYYYAADFFPGRNGLFLTRLLICTPVHIAFSAFMGLAFYIWINNAKAWGIVLYALAYAALVHGIYDLVIFNGWSVVVLALVIWLSLKATLAMLRYATAISPFRKTLGALLSNQAPPAQPGMACPGCGSDRPKPTWYLGAIPIQKCDRCPCHITTRKGLFAIFRYFADAFERLSPHVKAIPGTWPAQYTLYDGNRMTDRLACFELPQLNETLEDLNRGTIRRMEAHWWFPEYLFRHPGKKIALNPGRLAWRGVRLLRRRLIHPLATSSRKPIHQPDGPGPNWNWGAFLIPELWYPIHGIMGVGLLWVTFYAMAAWLVSRGGMGLRPGILWGCFVLLRLAGGRLGPLLHYYRHGRWP
jgi:RsiW-degrading membrane proteinase PrsW (M82 family)